MPTGTRSRSPGWSQYLKALAEGPQPSTTLKWMGYSAAYETVVELATGAGELSHRALDEVNRGMTTSFLRAALVMHGVLEPRPEQTAKFERAARAAVRGLPAGEDRAQIRAFALWHVQHDLARRERRGRTSEKSAQSSLRLVRAAVELSAWASTQGLTLGQLRQEHLDCWLEDGSSVTANVGPFLRWAARGGLMAPLNPGRRAARAHVEPISNDERLGVARRLLHDDQVDLRDRVAGLLILIYAQPLTRILSLTIGDVVIGGDRVCISLGREPVELPEPVAQLAATLARDPAGRASTAIAGATPRWLFQGMRVGEPLSHSRASRRLNRLGVRTLGGRTSAIIGLAAALPPAILADLLGISETRAGKWYRLAGGEWNGYLAGAARGSRQADDQRPHVTDRPSGEEGKMRRPASRSDAELFAGTPTTPEAFGEFYRRHEQAVLRFFLYWCRSADLAADLTAETFAAVFESLPRYEPERGEPRAWLFGIAQSILARSVRRGRVEDQTRLRLGLAPVVVDDDALDRIEALASQDGSALEALDGLSEVLHEAVSGRVLQEREYRELAEALDCSQSVVRQRVKRGLARIRDRLEVKP